MCLHDNTKQLQLTPKTYLEVQPHALAIFLCWHWDNHVDVLSGQFNQNIVARMDTLMCDAKGKCFPFTSRSRLHMDFITSSWFLVSDDDPSTQKAHFGQNDMIFNTIPKSIGTGAYYVRFFSSIFFSPVSTPFDPGRILLPRQPPGRCVTEP